MSRVSVTVVGGGIAGLTAAYRLKKMNIDVLLLEEKNEAGGNIRTLNSDGFIMETGPHTFMGSSEFLWKLIDELDFHDYIEQARPESRNRYIYRHGKLTPLPMNMITFLKTSLLSHQAKLRLLMEPLVPGRAKDDETAWEFFSRRFGKEAATYIMSPFISGVYAGDVNMLGARAAFNKFWRFEKESGSMILGALKYMRAKRKRLQAEGKMPRKGLYSCKGGLGALTRKLASELSQNIVTGIHVNSINHCGSGFVVEGDNRMIETASVIVAVPPNRAGELFKQSLPETFSMFNLIPMAPVILAHWHIPDEKKMFPEGFGFLMPRTERLRILGTLFPSTMFGKRAREGYRLYASYYGGMTDRNIMDMNDGKLSSLIVNEHEHIFKATLHQTKILKILRYDNAIPQLLPRHPEHVSSIVKTLQERLPGVFLAGNYLTGVGMENAVESGFSASETCRKFLETRIESQCHETVSY